MTPHKQPPVSVSPPSHPQLLSPRLPLCYYYGETVRPPCLVSSARHDYLLTVTQTRHHTTHPTGREAMSHTHAKGAIARLRAEKEARLLSVEEGLRLCDEAGIELDGHTRHGVADVSTLNLQLAAILEKVTRHTSLCSVRARHLLRPSRCPRGQSKNTRGTGTGWRSPGNLSGGTAVVCTGRATSECGTDVQAHCTEFDGRP